MVKKQASAPVKERLSRERIVECAIALADAEGLDAVTIRRLAQDQGVTPMALYWHFKDKDLLLEGIAERLLSRVVIPPVTEEPWYDQLRDVLGALLEVLRAHPAVADLLKARSCCPSPAWRSPSTPWRCCAAPASPPSRQRSCPARPCTRSCCW